MEILEMILKAIKMFVLYTRTIDPNKITIEMDYKNAEIRVTNTKIKKIPFTTIAATQAGKTVGIWQTESLPKNETITLDTAQLRDNGIIDIYFDGHCESNIENTTIIITIEWKRYLHRCKCVKVLRLD